MVSGYSSRPDHVYPQFIFFGDSITQCAEYDLLPPLRDAYNRKLDIVNRGFSGYTTRMALDVLPKFMPCPDQATVQLMIIFFGANDSCLPGEAQHVPLQGFADNVESIISHRCVAEHGTKVVLVVPGPVDEYSLIPRDPEDPNSGLKRSAIHTKLYADACRQVGTRLDVPTLDLWSIFMREAGWQPGQDLLGSKRCAASPVLRRLLPDGEYLQDADQRAQANRAWRSSLFSRRVQDHVQRAHRVNGKAIPRGDARQSALYISSLG